MDLSPALILITWAAGIAAGGALVAWWRVVGPGYLWLVAGVVAVIGGLGAAAGAGRAAARAARPDRPSGRRGPAWRPPVAAAGFDQTVEIATPVSLDGSGSSDPDGDPLLAWVENLPPGALFDAQRSGRDRVLQSSLLEHSPH